MKRLILAAAIAAVGLATTACASLPGMGGGSGDNLALLKEVNAHIERCDVQGQASSGPIPSASFSFNCKAAPAPAPAAPVSP